MQETVKSILRKASTKRSSRSGVSTNQDLPIGRTSRYSGSESQDAPTSYDHYPSSKSRSRPLISTDTGRDYDVSQELASENTQRPVKSRALKSESADVASNLDPQILADDLTGLSMDERVWCLYEENVADRNIEIYGIPPHSDDSSMNSPGWPLPENSLSEHKEQNNKHSIAYDLVGPSPSVSSFPGEQPHSSFDQCTQPPAQKPPSPEQRNPSSIDSASTSRKNYVNPMMSSSTMTEFSSSTSAQAQHHMRSDSAISHRPKDKTSQSEWKEQQRRLLDGVVDLEDSVDTDKEVKWAPAVTHEVVKPHEHEIIEPKIYREIHNYTYYHRILPVIHTEILPAKHFIHNPNGEGLIEITEDQIPSTLPYRRTWDLVQRDTPPEQPQHRWRTEPEIIEGETTITAEGFERKNTTIFYPPTIADMTEYEGLVQPVHFDHATGRSWLGDLTTVRKLIEQYPDAMKRDETKNTRKSYDDGLQKVRSSHSIRRKPVGSSDVTFV